MTKEGTYRKERGDRFSQAILLGILPSQEEYSVPLVLGVYFLQQFHMFASGKVGGHADFFQIRNRHRVPIFWLIDQNKVGQIDALGGLTCVIPNRLAAACSAAVRFSGCCH